MPCGSIALLSDTFDSSDPLPMFVPFADTGVTAAEAGGQLVISLAAGTGNGFGGYESQHRYDLTEGAFEAKIAQLGGESTVIEIRAHSGERAQLAVESGNLVANVHGVPSPGTRRSIPYDPAQVHWRIRVAGTRMYWETSADRTAWNELHAEATPFDVRHVTAFLSAGGQLPTTSTARFDEVNRIVPAGARHCPVTQLVDDFAATPFSPTWNNYVNGSCTIDETGGDLALSFPGINESYCGINSSHLFDLTQGEIVIDSAGLPIRTNFVTYLQAVSPANDETRIEMTLESGMLRLVNRINTTIGPEESLPYSRTTHRYWRLRVVGSQVEFATAPDGSPTDWSPRATFAPGFDVSASTMAFGAGNYAAVSPSGTVTVELPGINAP